LPLHAGLPIDPPIVIDDLPKRKLTSINEARAYVKELLHERRFSKWREMLARLDGVKSEDKAVEAVGALREPLTMEHLATG
jgi:hypothetical protein